ncbi:MAG: hypothetical protein K2W96_19400 [Gemmataceae bacterium]|nr:hypothetical protein [Gemmataceae bacterium]
MRAFPVLLLLAAGCVPDETPAPRPAPQHVPNRFDPAKAGSIEGVVRWIGHVPAVPPFRSVEFVQEWQVGPNNRIRGFPNPAAPQVAEGGLAGAVVLVRGIDASRVRPWDHPPPSVHLRDLRLAVRQGEREGIGLARLGDPLRFVNEDDPLHTVQARGACYFGLTLPRKGTERAWPLDAPGLVELRSGAGFWWMRGHVFVSDHACVAVTDARGRFRIGGVPEGACEVVAVHPDWRVREKERNQDNLRVTAVSFGVPLESSAPLRVEAGRPASVELRLGITP